MKGITAPIDRDELENAQEANEFCRRVWAEKAAREESARKTAYGILVRKHPDDASITQLIVPESLRGRLLNLAHCSKLSGNQGRRRRVSN